MTPEVELWWSPALLLAITVVSIHVSDRRRARQMHRAIQAVERRVVPVQASNRGIYDWAIEGYTGEA